jgi:hypothetical protein
MSRKCLRAQINDNDVVRRQECHKRLKAQMSGIHATMIKIRR